MRTKLSIANPFECGRWGFAWEHVKQQFGAHLDFGCGTCVFLNSLRGKDLELLVGVDASGEAVAQANERFGDLHVEKVSSPPELPFGDNTFDSISLLDVIEHVFEQGQTLRELRRVLKPGGTLIVTVPGRHVFSFMDMGNFKFRFPRLHRWYYSLRHGRRAYESRYAANPDNLVGDISAIKLWHEHFTRKKLDTMLQSMGFAIELFDGEGLFTRPIDNVSYLVRPIKPLFMLLTKLKYLDARLFGSANVFCVASKPVDTGGDD